MEEKCFKVPERCGLLAIAQELNEAFAEGWHYVAHFPVDREILVILGREARLAAANGKPKTKVKA